MKHSTLGLFLNLGESFTSLGSQAELMINQNIKAFAKAFDQVYIFTYRQEKINLPENCILVTPPWPLHRYLYALLLPLIHSRIIRQCHLLRCFQLSGTVPALICKLVYGSKFVFNYGYDYVSFAKIEGKFIQAQLFSLLSPIAVKFAAVVIIKSQSLKIKGHYLPNGVDPKLFIPKKSYRLSSPPIILYVGRLEPQKNLPTLLKSATKIKAIPQVIFIGSGSQKLALLNQAKKFKLKLVIKHRISHSQLPVIYRSADIFVLPSLIEGSPKVLLEAMASGLPCVASDILQHREVITHQRTGMLIQPTSLALSQAIDKLLRSTHLRRRLGQAARERIKADFDIKSIMAQEVKILKSV